MRFELVNVSAPGVVFSLSGPNGWIGFSNQTASSDLLSLPYSGAYTIAAMNSGGQYDVAYAFRLVETAQTDLSLGTNFTGHFVGSGQAQIFRINLPTNTPLQVVLNNSASGNQNELYLKFGLPPTRGDYDFRSTGGPGANQEILAPGAPAGVWYVLVYADLILSPGDFSIQVTASSLNLAAVTPDTCSDATDALLNLSGAGFNSATQARLVAADGTAYSPSFVEADSFTQLRALFPGGSLPAGTYSILVSQPGVEAAQLTNAFQIIAGGKANLVCWCVLPKQVGRHAPATFYVQFANSGTIPMAAPLLTLQGGNDRPLLTLDATRQSQGVWTSAMPEGFGYSVQFFANGQTPGVLNPGETNQVPVYYGGLEPPGTLRIRTSSCISPPPPPTTIRPSTGLA